MEIKLKSSSQLTVLNSSGNNILSIDESTKSVTIDGKSVDKLVEIAWADLKSLRDNSQLVPGTFYRITDYECTTTTTNTSSAGHQFDIIVRADSTNKLSEEASAILHSGDTYFSGCKLEAWRLWYSLDNDGDRFGWALFESDTYSFTASASSFPTMTFYRDTSLDKTDYYAFRGSYISGGQTYYQTVYTDTLDLSTSMQLYKYNSSSGSMSAMSSYSISEVVTPRAGGKGVIYRMIDEFNNDCPYDFKNILFTVSGKYTNAYTFSYTESSVIKDASLLGLSKECYSNVMKEYINYRNKQQLNFNVFYSESSTASFSCYSNTFGICCYNNTFKQGCYNNTFVCGCSSNTFGTTCCYHILGSYCHSNTFGNGCSDNIFGTFCYSNTFGSSCSCNTLGCGCSSNTSGYSSSYNAFGNYCQSNKYGNYCNNNTFGSGCKYITFGASVGKDYYINNIVDNGCQYLCIDTSGTTSYSNLVKNIHVHSGVVGSSSSNPRTITVDRNLAYSTDIYANGSKEIILDD